MAPGQSGVELDILPIRATLPGPEVTLQECLALAYERHPVIASQHQIVLQAQAALDSIWALYYPSLGINSSVTRQSLTAFAGGAVLPFNSYLTQLNLTQTILDSGQRREQVLSAEEGMKSAILTFQNTWINQVQQIQQAFCDTVQAELLLATTKDNLGRTKQNQTVAESFYVAGQKSKIDVTQAQTQVAQAEVRVIQAQNQIRDLRLNLAQLTGVPSSYLEGRPLENLLIQPVQEPPHEEALKRLEEHPQITSLEATARSNDALERLQWANQLPSLTGNAGYGVQGADNPQFRFWQAGLQLNIPFYNPATEPNARRFKALADQLRHDRDTARIQLVQLLDTAYADMQAARRRVEVAAKETRLALENFRLAQRRYEATLSDITELINARSFVVNAQTDYVTALHDRKVAEGRLDQAIAAATPPAGDPGAPIPPAIPKGLPSP